MSGLAFVKGHGTENDFVLLPSPPALSTELVVALCDRRRGIGADGVLGVVATGGDPAWFMDYRNADGSLAEMCGNGIRVFARYLVDAGLAASGELRIDTRDGIKTVHVPAHGPVTVEMGAYELLPDTTVVADGHEWPGLGVSLGNPHVVVRVHDPGEAGALRAAPLIAGDGYPDGANVEFVAVRAPGRLAMRVHERGVGETRSCGTGACAAAVAAAAWGEAPAGPVDVSVPGGELAVELVDGGRVRLTGPAVLVASGTVSEGWLEVG